MKYTVKWSNHEREMETIEEAIEFAHAQMKAPTLEDLLNWREAEPVCIYRDDELLVEYI